MAVGETTEGSRRKWRVTTGGSRTAHHRALWLLADFRRLETLVVPPG